MRMTVKRTQTNTHTHTPTHTHTHTQTHTHTNYSHTHLYTYIIFVVGAVKLTQYMHIDIPHMFCTPARFQKPTAHAILLVIVSMNTRLRCSSFSIDRLGPFRSSLGSVDVWGPTSSTISACSFGAESLQRFALCQSEGSASSTKALGPRGRVHDDCMDSME